ncbi:hypothetical protein ACTWJ8_40690 (plasmid) [Streptomyces sp. SDT5-1]|uniref:hypothetical protein n=1 Tax=Streptomyces sp. SDT5-1 TaxID=3406418 RepID=UPI003FD4D886
MAITMENFALKWTDPDGKAHASACAYSAKSAERRKKELEAARCTNVQIIPVEPGEVLTAEQPG